jgi:hypothetical protein
MNQLITTRTVSAGAFVTMAAIGFMSLGTSTQASANVLSCNAKTFNATVSCCEQMSKAERPSWMIASNSNCHTAVKCYKSRRCYVVLLLDESNERHGTKNSSRSKR